jgi:beta-glucosidase
MRQPFPPGFLWGCATSAYQIEGSPLADGAGVSNWHRFVRTPGRVFGGETGDVACDHYRRMKEDVALMRELGLTAYRFSIAWNRVLPEGRGAVNAAGLGFYERLVDELLAAGIQPMATLHHWDLPAALDDRGGWLNPDMPDWFADYAQVCFKALDDRVPMWATLNEPWVVADGGFMQGLLAPGHKSAYEAAIAAHRLMQAHARGVQAYRATGKNRIGLVVNIEPKHLPADATDADRHAARLADAYMNRQYLDPALLGTYPGELREVFGEAWPDWPAAEVEALKQPIDFLGLNYYTRAVVRHDARAWPVPAVAERQPGGIHTEMGWELHPQSLADTLDARALRRPAALRDRERRRLLRPARGHRRPRRRPAARALPAHPHRRRAGRHEPRRRRARLLRLVAVRQPRMVAGLRQALWPGACGLSDTDPHAQGECALLC